MVRSSTGREVSHQAAPRAARAVRNDSPGEPSPPHPLDRADHRRAGDPRRRRAHARLEGAALLDLRLDPAGQGRGPARRPRGPVPLRRAPGRGPERGRAERSASRVLADAFASEVEAGRGDRPDHDPAHRPRRRRRRRAPTPPACRRAPATTRSRTRRPSCASRATARLPGPGRDDGDRRPPHHLPGAVPADRRDPARRRDHAPDALRNLHLRGREARDRRARRRRDRRERRLRPAWCSRPATRSTAPRSATRSSRS